MEARIRTRARGYSAPLRIASVYAAFGILWILFSDRILLVISASSEQFARMQSVKGSVYVVVTAVLVYLLVRSFAVRQLAVQEQLRERERVLEQKLRERNTLLKEVFHRVKNNLQIVLSIMNLSSRGIEDDEAAASLQRVTQRVHTVAMVHENLLAGEDLEMIHCGRFIHALVHRAAPARRPDLTLSLDGAEEECRLPLETSVPWGLVVNELLSNALEHAFPADQPGTVEVRLRYEAGDTATGKDEMLITTVLDTGTGCPDGGRGAAPGTGVGLMLAQALAGQARGTLRIGPRSDGGPGTEAALSVPLTPGRTPGVASGVASTAGS